MRVDAAQQKAKSSVLCATPMPVKTILSFSGGHIGASSRSSSSLKVHRNGGIGCTACPNSPFLANTVKAVVIDMFAWHALS